MKTFIPTCETLEKMKQEYKEAWPDWQEIMDQCNLIPYAFVEHMEACRICRFCMKELEERMQAEREWESCCRVAFGGKA